MPTSKFTEALTPALRMFLLHIGSRSSSTSHDSEHVSTFNCPNNSICCDFIAYPQREVLQNQNMILHDHQRSRNRSLCVQLFWPRVLVRKWLNISANSSDYSVDSDDSIHDSIGAEALCYWPKE